MGATISITYNLYKKTEYYLAHLMERVYNMKISETNLCPQCLIRLPYMEGFKRCGHCGSEIVSKMVDVPYGIWEIIMKYCDNKTKINLSLMHPEIYWPTHSENSENSEIIDLIFGKENIALLKSVSLPENVGFSQIEYLLLFVKFKKSIRYGKYFINRNYYVKCDNNTWMDMMAFDREYMAPGYNDGTLTTSTAKTNIAEIIAKIFVNNIIMSKFVRVNLQQDVYLHTTYFRLARRHLCKNCGMMTINKSFYKSNICESISSYFMTFCNKYCENSFYEVYKNACENCKTPIYCNECCLRTDCKKCKYQYKCNECNEIKCSVCSKTDIEYYILPKSYQKLFGNIRFCGIKCMMQKFDDNLDRYTSAIINQHDYQNAIIERQKREDRERYESKYLKKYGTTTFSQSRPFNNNCIYYDDRYYNDHY
jgi:hypothetical protein